MINNQDALEINDKVAFLEWLQMESFSPLGAEIQELKAVAAKWTKHKADEDMRYCERLVAARAAKCGPDQGTR